MVSRKPLRVSSLVACVVALARAAGTIGCQAAGRSRKEKKKKPPPAAAQGTVVTTVDDLVITLEEVDSRAMRSKVAESFSRESAHARR